MIRVVQGCVVTYGLPGLLAICACGPAVSSSGGSTGQSNATSTRPANTGVMPPRTGTTQSAEPSDEETTSVIFGFDCAPSPLGEGYTPRCVPSAACSTWGPDCGSDQKCTALADDGSSVWNGNDCVPLSPNPVGVGDPCVVEGSIASGLDSCAEGSMCWDVDEGTLQGTCVAFCQGVPIAPDCPEQTVCGRFNDLKLALCLPPCDPLAQSCELGSSCQPSASSNLFVCLPDGAGVFNDPGVELGTCAPGTTVLAPGTLGACAQGEDPCCATYCELANPACGPEQTCIGVIGAPESPIGVCVSPP